MDCCIPAVQNIKHWAASQVFTNIKEPVMLHIKCNKSHSDYTVIDLGESSQRDLFSTEKTLLRVQKVEENVQV